MTINKAFWCHVPNMICGGPEVIKNSIRDSKQLNFLAPLLASPLISYLSSPLIASPRHEAVPRCGDPLFADPPCLVGGKSLVKHEAGFVGRSSFFR